MPAIKVGDINLYYEVQGQGFPLVLIAGIGYHSGCWFSVLPHFSRDFQVVVFDNRGVGRSDKPAADYSIEMFADDTAKLLKAVGIPRAHVLGRSMGGPSPSNWPSATRRWWRGWCWWLPSARHHPLACWCWMCGSRWA